MSVKKCWLVLMTSYVISDPLNYRLPLEVKPFRYWLEIAPDFENDKFTGEVKIDVQAMQNANSITLHNNGLQMPSKDEIKVCELETENYLDLESVGQIGTSQQQFFQINLSNPLVADTKYQISIPNFTRQFSTEASGFYYAIYEDEDGNNKTFATTHFQPCAARKAFPCFDEPALKARFNVRIRRPSNAYHSTFNTPKDVNLSSDLLDVFKETGIMSTYLVTFIISQMDFSETLGKHRILGKPQDIKNGLHKFSLNASYQVLNAMEDYTGIPYAFEKVDHVAIPKDYFYFEAMENWGLITYNDRELMIPENASTSKKEYLLSVIAHEIVHQWFGNLISPEWWEFTWLNEGFANYLQHVIADKIEPTMDFAREMVVNTVQVAMTYDGYSMTRPMTSPATDPNQIQNLFDIISYSKSGSIIRMLEHVITTPVFRKGLSYYLNERKFESANPSQLYENLQKAVNEQGGFSVSEDVSQFMTTWEKTAGVPLVTVTRVYEAKENNVQLEQRKFLNNQLGGGEGNWKIPINFATASHPTFEVTTPEVWLSQARDVITLSQLNDNDWLIANKLQTGYYRVNYDLKNWNLLIDALLADHLKIDAINRAQLLDDCAFLAKSGDIPQDINIRLQKYLVNETDPIPLAVQQNTFRYMDNLLRDSKEYKHFRQHVLGTFKNTYSHLTFNEKTDDTLMDKKLRADILFWLCKVGHKECRHKCLKTFRAWKKHHKEIPADLQRPVFCGAMRVGNHHDFIYLLNYFIETKTPYLEELFGACLVCAENKTRVAEVLEYAYNKSSTSLINMMLKAASDSSKYGLQAVLEFVPKHYGQEEEKSQPETTKIIDSLALHIFLEHHLLPRRPVLRTSPNGNAFLYFKKIVADRKIWKKKHKTHLVEALKKHGAKFRCN